MSADNETINILVDGKTGTSYDLGRLVGV